MKIKMRKLKKKYNKFRLDLHKEKPDFKNQSGFSNKGSELFVHIGHY